MKCTLFIISIAISLATNIFAVEQPVIINTGEATALTLPSSVQFKFVRHFSGETLQAAIEQYNTFIEAAPKAIRGSELQPTEILVSPPNFTSFEQKQVGALVRISFSMAIFNTAKTGPIQFAGLWKKLADLAKTMKCTLSTPEFSAADPESIMAEALSRATENAYPPAEAIALAVKTNIYAVDKVEVLSIEWEQKPENQTAEVPQIACKAKVQVTYSLAPQ